MPVAPLRTCLWFDSQAQEAAAFYTKLFGGTVDGVMHAPADFPGGKKGQLLLVRFTILGHSFEALNGGPLFKPNEAMSLVVEVDTQAEVDKYWKGLQEGGGSPAPCGWCKDRFGFSWQVVPRVLREAEQGKDAKASERAFTAVLQMQKIDVAKIQAAMEGT